MPLDLIAVSRFARADEYAGVWAIEPTRGAALWERCKDANFHLHVEERKANPPKLSSQLQMVKVGNGPGAVNIAIVMLTGPLMKAVSSMDSGTSTVQARRDIRKAASDPEVAAILLAIDSPGGTVSGTADLGAEVAAAGKKKPMWAFVDDLGASAAYWIASQAAKVYANDRTALVGSIGTLAVIYDVSARAEAEGVKTLVFGTGPLKGAGAPGSPVSEEQQEYFRGLVADAQVAFDAAVRRGRGLTDKQLSDVKSGGVFPASEALDLKLIDGIQSMDKTLMELASEVRRQTRASSTGATGPIPVRSVAVEETVTTIEAPATSAVVGSIVGLTPTSTSPTIASAIEESRKAHAAELRRVAEIQKLAAKHPAIAAEAIEKGWNADATELAVMKADLANNVRPFNPAIVDAGHDATCTRQALEGALLLRCGFRLDHPAMHSERAMHLPQWMRQNINADHRQKAMEHAHRYSDTSLLDICREAIRLDGKSIPHGRDAIIQAAFSGGSLTNIFTTNVNAMLLMTFADAPDTTQGWTQTVDVADFKTQERVRMKRLGGSLPKLPRGSEADHAQRSDQAESYKISRYAEQFVVDEQDIIDDMLNAISDMPVEFGRKAARQRPDLVYAILLSNPTLTATGRELFNSTDDNTESSASLSASSLKNAIAAMQLVQENSVNLNLTPTHLLVPPTLRFTARELIQSSTIVIAQGNTTTGVTERGSMNTLQGEGLNLVSDPRLENGVVDPDSGDTASGSSSTWFLASNMGPTIEVAYRRGTGRMPQVRSFMLDKGTWGIGWDINLDIGAKAMEWRTLRKMTQ